MTSEIKPLTGLPAWKALQAHYERVRNVHLRELFRTDPRRGERMAIEAEGIYLDYSKNRVTDETLALLLQLAQQADLPARIAAMFRGDKINITENRAVLHVALRAPKGDTILVDGENVVPQVHAVLDKMAEFSQRISQPRLERPYGKAHPQHRQYRHRGLRPGAGDGIRGP